MTKANFLLFMWAAATLSAPAQALESANRCARFGADYVAVAGSTGCVRLGGHVRVVMGPHQLASGGAPMGYAAQDGFRNVADQAARQSLTSFDLFRR